MNYFSTVLKIYQTVAFYKLIGTLPNDKPSVLCQPYYNITAPKVQKFAEIVTNIHLNRTFIQTNIRTF